MKITRGDLSKVAENGVISADQAEAVWQELERLKPHRLEFTFSNTLYYSGAVLMLVSMGWFMNLAWESLSGLGVSIISAVYAACFVWLAMRLNKGHGLWRPGGLLMVAAVGMVPLFVYGIQKYFGLWPVDEPGQFADYHRYIRGCWVFMSFATIAASALALRVYPFPFLTMPAAVAMWYLTMDMVPWLFGTEPLDWEARQVISIFFGMAMLVGAYWADWKVRGQDYAFWLYLFGMIAFWGGITSFDSDNELGKFLYFILNIVIMLKGVLLRRRVILAFGAIGTLGYLGHLAHHVFEDLLLFPPVLLALGLVIIFLGVKWQKNVARIEAFVWARVPGWVRGYLPPERE